MTKNPHAVPGSTVHVTRPISLVVNDNEHFPIGEVLPIGSTFVITESLVRNNTDRFGASVFDTVGEPDSPLQAGAWPEGKLPYKQGDADWAIARDKAQREAWAQTTEAERTKALADVNSRFGREVTSVTTQVFQ
ncbi:hypothetical protein BH11ACT5_BH11ACT5_02650 [soil metagenome]